MINKRKNSPTKQTKQQNASMCICRFIPVCVLELNKQPFNVICYYLPGQQRHTNEIQRKKEEEEKVITINTHAQ